ncbi:rab3 GTPase-activating protein regulatory subunit [Trichoplusia ni]|uniref:Rab3 GTPase-activating protein regulatory subunit n=1 Tax=Trichoplusia ni TaxID=7111 RepID=A0A7E5VW34_TRINI|nr:rab3 GTPase-activating protein regulatory subunit [Trichoplusia ni]
MSCQVEQIADCGDISTLGRALFIKEKEDSNWLTQCAISMSSCSSLLAVGYQNRLCLLTNQWISQTNSNTFLISWSGTLPSDITALLALPICPSQQSSQNGPDWFCIIVGFKNGSVGFYTNTGHLMLLEKFDEKPVLKISCHTGTYGTLPDDIHILFQSSECIISASSLYQTLRNAKAHLAKVHAGIKDDYTVDSRSLGIRKWMFSDQEVMNDAAVVGLDLKNTYDHLLAASTYGGYDIWYRSVPPVNTLILAAGAQPYIGFHYALEGGTIPPLQDVARVVANKIKSALPGWLGGNSTENIAAGNEPLIRSEVLSKRNGLYDGQRQGNVVAISPDRRLAAIADSFGRVAVLDVTRGHLIRLFKGYRDAQCAFVQIFDMNDKKPQLSVVKDLRRAIFLIIYSPKKGLIDIRLMQKGDRVATFTATKNGKLLYNTCGLVGAEKKYSHKKLNLPEVQCVLIDPDGKIKKFNIPFFFALDGEHSLRSKDLYMLKELREDLKKTSADYSVDEIIKKVSDLKTLDAKRHCIDMLLRKYEISPRDLMTCLNLLWNSFKSDLNLEEFELKNYFATLGLATLFYRYINGDSADDMQDLTDKIHIFLHFDEGDEIAIESIENETNENDQALTFELLEDDNCILERLLTLAQENNYKEHQVRVTFADNNTSTYKEFVSCFKLDKNSHYMSISFDTSSEKINNIACFTFKAVFKIQESHLLSKFIKECKVDPMQIVKLLIMHIMNMPLEEISLELIEQFIEVVYYICNASEEATITAYNEISTWWQGIRDILVEMPCPLRSMTVAMACKAVSKIFETKTQEKDEEIWESVTKENAKWGILIGKLEDISILSIILMFKDPFKGKSLPKLHVAEFDINLKNIYTRGKGSVTELIAKWLCGMGVLPEAIVANELMEKYASLGLELPNSNDDNDCDYLYIENNRLYVDENPKFFKWFSLLRQQFPLSTSADYIISNMCWEYSMAWQKSMQTLEYLNTVLECLKCISSIHIRFGLFSIIWSTYIKHMFEVSCRLVNKVGRLPKDPLCLQDVGFDNTTMTTFLKTITAYLEDFLNCSNSPFNQEKQDIQFEKIWGESLPSLVEVAQNTNNVNNDILNLNYQISCTVYYICHFNIKLTKPLESLYDVDYQYVLEALTGSTHNRQINMKASDKLRNPRMKFITKLIRHAVESITTTDCVGPYPTYNSEECTAWIQRIEHLAELWSIDEDFIIRQQVISLYHLGYDMLAENIISLLKEPEIVLPSIMAITTQRFKRSLEHSSNQPEWIVTMPPQLYKRLQGTVLDTSIPAHPSLATTKIVLQKILVQIDKKTTKDPENYQEIKMAELFIESCDVLMRRKL